jgi:hypothetical protein
VVKGDVTHMAILKDLEESFRKASKENQDANSDFHEVLISEEDRDLATTKEEIERVLGGRWLGSALVPPKVMQGHLVGCNEEQQILKRICNSRS